MKGCEISESMVGERSREAEKLLDPNLDILGSVAIDISKSYDVI